VNGWTALPPETPASHWRIVDGIPGTDERHVGLAQDEGDALLFAASGDMYDALCALMMAVDSFLGVGITQDWRPVSNWRPVWDAMDRGRAAVRKARGESCA